MITFFLSLWDWLTSTFVGKIAASLFVSMVPLIELRGGIPIAVGLGLDPHIAIPVCVVGNIVPVIPILLVIRRLFWWMRHQGRGMQKLVEWMERRVNKHRDVLDKYAWMGLVILTAIPFPGTGAWTSSMLAGLTGMRFKHAIPAIALGVIIAAVIMSVVSYSVAAVV